MREDIFKSDSTKVKKKKTWNKNNKGQNQHLKITPTAAEQHNSY